MSRNNPLDTLGLDEHPSLEVLRQYQNGELPESQKHLVERHLLSCELCADLLGGMALAQPARVRTAVRETRGRLKHLLAQKKRKRKAFQWPVWQTTAVLLVLLFAIAEVVYHHYFAQPEKPSTEQSSPAPATWKLHGKVISPENVPLGSATVLVNGSSSTVRTDGNGFFEADIPPGKADLLITAPGYKPKGVFIDQTRDTVEILMDR
jgi:hypothetical protein